MAFYESFYVRKVGRQGRVYYHLKNMDIDRIESWEWVDNEHTKIFTESGDKFIAKIRQKELTDLMMSSLDPFGRLFLFNEN